MSVTTAPVTKSASSIATGIPAIDQCLQTLLNGGMSFTLLSCPFSTPLAFTGNVTVDVAGSGTSATFSGRATLGAPFEIAADIVITANASGDWMVELTLPDVSSITDRVMRSVADPTSRSIYDKVIKPYLRFYQNAAVAIASSDTVDPAGRDVYAGINFYATFSPFEVAPLDSVDRTFPAFKLRSLTTTVHLACKTSVPGFAFLIAGEINCAVPFGTPTVTFTQCALSIDQSMTDLTLGASCRFTLKAGGDVLLLRGGFTLDPRGEARFSLALDVADGAWQNPLGIRGLTIGGLGIDIGAGPEFPWIILGARGQALLGTDARPLTDAELGLLLDTAVPENCVLSVHSVQGLDLPALARAFISPSLAAMPILNVSLSNLALDLSPSGGTIAGKTYAAGMTGSGALNLWGWKAHAAGSFDWSGGFSLAGAMDPVDLAISNMPVLRLRGGSRSSASGPELRIDCTPSSFAARASMQLSLFGVASMVTDVDIKDPDDVTIMFKATADSIYANAAVRLSGATATARGNAAFNYSFKTLGMSCKVAMTATVDVTIDAARAHLAESITFVANIGDVKIPLHIEASTPRLSTMPDVDRLFRSTMASGTEAVLEFTERVATELARQALGAAGNIGAIAQTFVTTVAPAFFSSMLQYSGASAEQVAHWTVDTCDVAAEQAVAYLGLGKDEAIHLLDTSFDMTESEARSAYNSVVDTMGGWVDDAADAIGGLFS